MKAFLIFLFIVIFTQADQVAYKRSFFSNGKVKSEGWIDGDLKVKYWYFFYENGKIASKGHYLNNQKAGYWYFYDKKGVLFKEGHFKEGKAQNWWIIYDIAADSKDTIVKKYQYQNNKKNGFCLWYKNGKIFKAEKFDEDRKTGEWTNLLSFKKDNPQAFLK